MDFSKLPAVGELVVARMSGPRNEPFGIGVVLAAPTLRHDPPERTHTLSFKRSPSTGAPFVSAAAAAADGSSEIARLTAEQLDDLPLSQVARIPAEELAMLIRQPSAVAADTQESFFEVRVHWYDLEASWVEKLNLLKDSWWSHRYAEHRVSDAKELARVPPPCSVPWIVDQYKKAVFLLKPAEADNDNKVEGLLSVSSLILWGSKSQLLTAAGQITPQAFALIRADLLELRPQQETKSRRSPARAAAVRRRSHTADDDEEESKEEEEAGEKSAKRRKQHSSAGESSPHASPRPRRTSQPVAAAAAAAAAAADETGIEAAMTDEDDGRTQPLPLRRQQPPHPSQPRERKCPRPSLTAGACAAPAAASSCASCKHLRRLLTMQAEDLENVRRLIAAAASRASLGAAP